MIQTHYEMLWNLHFPVYWTTLKVNVFHTHKHTHIHKFNFFCLFSSAPLFPIFRSLSINATTTKDGGGFMRSVSLQQFTNTCANTESDVYKRLSMAYKVGGSNGMPIASDNHFTHFGGKIWPWPLTLTFGQGHQHLGHWVRLIGLYLGKKYEVCRWNSLRDMTSSLVFYPFLGKFDFDLRSRSSAFWSLDSHLYVLPWYQVWSL